MVTVFLLGKTQAQTASSGETPSYLQEYHDQWKQDAKAANLAWFGDAKFGMMISFSPASAVGTAGWMQANPTWSSWHGRNRVLGPEDYGTYLTDKFEPQFNDPAGQKILDQFTGKQFDAERIADLAVAAGMRYIIFTSQHVCGRMFLFDTATSPVCSTKLAPQRDFVAELATACEKRNLGLFLYVMPPYTDEAARDRGRQMLTELLTNYGPIAGIWFDGVGEAYLRPQAFQVGEVSKTYALVRKLQPHCLISFKTGFTGEEDYLAPEWHQCSYDKDGLPGLKGIVPERVRRVWKETLRSKPVEISSTMIHGNKWFDVAGRKHKSVDQVIQQYSFARGLGLNFALNIGLREDGSIHPADEKVLRAAGKQLKQAENQGPETALAK